MRTLAPLILVATIGNCMRQAAIETSPGVGDRLVVHSFKYGLAGAHANSPSVKLAVGTDSALGDEAVLIVEYPAAGNDPASRDAAIRPTRIFSRPVPAPRRRST